MRSRRLPFRSKAEKYLTSSEVTLLYHLCYRRVTDTRQSGVQSFVTLDTQNKRYVETVHCAIILTTLGSDAIERNIEFGIVVFIEPQAQEVSSFLDHRLKE